MGARGDGRTKTWNLCRWLQVKSLAVRGGVEDASGVSAIMLDNNDDDDRGVDGMR